jgi:hypothetical protein
MLRDRLVEVETVRLVLKKHPQTLAEAHVVYSCRAERGVHLPDGETVLEVYRRALDPSHPVV